MKRTLVASLAFNVIMFLAAAIWGIRHFGWRRAEAAHRKVTDNPQYNEQLKIWGAYWGDQPIVLLGDSHFYKCHWDELLNKGGISNQGIGSDVTEGYLMRVSYVFDKHPKICFIEGGGNDIEQGVRCYQIFRNIQRLVDTVSGKGIIPVLVTVPYELATLPGAMEYNKSIDSLNNQLRFYATSSDIEMIDWNKMTESNGGLSPDVAQNDGAHLRAAAYENCAIEMKILLNRHGL